MNAAKAFLPGYALSIADKASKDRYLVKLAEIGGLDPYETTRGDEWQDDVDLWPATTCIHIGMYLLLTPSPYSKQDLLNYKSLDCYVNFVSGWVREIFVRVIEEKRVVIAKVNHSQRLSEKPLTPWIIANSDGAIITAHCDCMAGLGETCSHIASVLWAIESGVRLRDSLTVTQKKAYWVIPHAVKQVPYATVSDVTFIGKKRSQQLILNVDASLAPSVSSPCLSSTASAILPSCASGSSSTRSRLSKKTSLSLTAPSDEEMDSFFASLSSCSKSRPAILSLVEPYNLSYIPKAMDENLPMCLFEIRKPEYLNYSYDQLLRLAKELTFVITPEQVQAVEEKTRLQAKDPFWFTMRSGRVTASQFKRASHTDPASPSISLIMSICHPELNRFKTQATCWGCEHEKVALDEYCSMHASKCKDGNLKVEQCGLFLDVENPFIGASPDGLVMCSFCGDGVCEIKCPYCHKDDHIGDATTEDHAFCLGENVDGEVALKHNHAYYYQIQCQLFCTKRSYCDFVVWTQCDIHIERVFPDEDFWFENVSRVKHFFITAILPELLGKFYSRTSAIESRSISEDDIDHHEKTSSALESEDTFCYCHGPDEGQMVGCDNPSCLYGKWFHLECLGLKCLPKSKHWYCPDCRKLDKFRLKKQ